MVEMHHWYENVDRDDFKVHLVHSKDYVLPTLHRSLGEYAARKLKERGVEMVLEERVRSVTAKHVKLESGREIDTYTVISTIGNAPHPVVVELADELSLPTEGGRLKIERTGQATPVDWLWSAGDCAAMPMENGETCPATAQFAQRQGTLVGKNLLALRRKKEPSNFTFKGLGELAAIGHHTAVGEIMGFKFSGFFAWWIWRTVYVSKLPGLQRKLRVLLDWTFDLFFPRDINLLSPQYTRLLKEIYLEKGDILFHPNEPAFSLYFVKQGQVDVYDGDRLVKSVFEGDYFGERALLEDGIWRFRAVAQTSSKLIALGAREFHALVQGSDSLKKMFVRSSQSYLSRAEIDELKAELIPETLEMRASELMNRKIDALTPETFVDDALVIIRENRHGSYPVVDADGKLLGSIKRDDIYDYVKGHSPGERRRIADLPLNHLPSATQETTGSELVDLILRSGRNKIHVIDHDGRLCGLITTADLLDHAQRLQKLLAGQEDSTVSTPGSK
jgi:NADH dehydrogenase